MKNLILLFLFSLFVGCKSSSGGLSNQMTKQSAQSTASAEIEKMGYNSNEMHQEINLYNTSYSKCLPENSESKYVKERQKKLENRRYWAVYYYPKAVTAKGGDVCIFIDANTGEIITDYRGK